MLLLRTDREEAVDEANHNGINDVDVEVLMKLIIVEPMMLMEREITIAEEEMVFDGSVGVAVLRNGRGKHRGT